MLQSKGFGAVENATRCNRLVATIVLFVGDILKMDHHCFWVGALNYKYFLFFLFYTSLETSPVTSSLLPHFIAFFIEGEILGTPCTSGPTFTWPPPHTTNKTYLLPHLLLFNSSISKFNFFF